MDGTNQTLTKIKNKNLSLNRLAPEVSLNYNSTSGKSLEDNEAFEDEKEEEEESGLYESEMINLNQKKPNLMRKNQKKNTTDNTPIENSFYSYLQDPNTPSKKFKSGTESQLDFPRTTLQRFMAP